MMCERADPVNSDDVDTVQNVWCDKTPLSQSSDIQFHTVTSLSNFIRWDGCGSSVSVLIIVIGMNTASASMWSLFSG